MVLFGRNKAQQVAPDEALPGRQRAMPVPAAHAVFTDRPIAPPFPDDLRTAVGYAGGHTPNPT